MSESISLRTEAESLGRYLLGKVPDAVSIAHYEAAVTRAPQPVDRDARILRFAVRNRWAIGLLDSALAFGKPNAALRLRLLTMTAILETRPAYADRYLPKNHTALFFPAAGWIAFRAVVKMITGKILLLFL